VIEEKMMSLNALALADWLLEVHLASKTLHQLPLMEGSLKVLLSLPLPLC